MDAMRNSKRPKQSSGSVLEIANYLILASLLCKNAQKFILRFLSIFQCLCYVNLIKTMLFKNKILKNILSAYMTIIGSVCCRVELINYNK